VGWAYARQCIGKLKNDKIPCKDDLNMEEEEEKEKKQEQWYLSS
jgi:hypothetical protein